mgnify:CR=1 FL=1
MRCVNHGGGRLRHPSTTKELSSMKTIKQWVGGEYYEGSPLGAITRQLAR